MKITNWPTWVEIDLGAIAHNVQVIRRAVGDRVRIMAVVKAEGYGHGIEEVAVTALAYGADCLGVTSLAEGKFLRERGIEVPILLLGITALADAACVVELGLTQTVCTMDLAQALSAAAVAQNRRALVHMKVDTGLTRFGVAPEAAPEFAAALQALPGIELEGVYTHFASPYDASDYTEVQFARFQVVLAELQARGINIPVKHCANSAAMYEFPEMHLDLVRCGFVLTNRSPAWHAGRELPLRDALQWKTRVVYLKSVPKGVSIGYDQAYVASRDMVIAIQQIGYSDGIDTSYKNKGKVLLGGRKCNIVGGIAMSHFMVDVTDIADRVQVGDEVVLIGRQGNEYLSVVDMSSTIGAGDAETMLRIHRKIPRVYTRDGELIKVKA